MERRFILWVECLGLTQCQTLVPNSLINASCYKARDCLPIYCPLANHLVSSDLSRICTAGRAGITRSICLPLPPGLCLVSAGIQVEKQSFLSCFHVQLRLSGQLLLWSLPWWFLAAGQSRSTCKPRNCHLRDHIPLGQSSVWLCFPYVLSFPAVSQPVIEVFKNKIGEENQRAASFYPPQHVGWLLTPLTWPL